MCFSTRVPTCEATTPSKPEGNWEWRCTEAMLDSDAAARLLRLTRLYGRADDPASAAADNEEAS